MSARNLAKLWSVWRADRRGVAAVEFALVIPLLLIFYIVGLQTALAVATARKVTDTTVELANVTGQYTTMSTTDVSNVFNASAQIMSPFSTQNLGIVLSELYTDSSGATTVKWSCHYNGATALTKGASYTLPSGMTAKSVYYIFVQTSYTYVPAVAYGMPVSIPMADHIIVQPRQSLQIPDPGCS